MTWKHGSIVVSLVLLSSCVEQQAPEAQFWSVRDMSRPQADGGFGEQLDFGGWKPRQLVATVGTPLFFEENAVSQAELNDGLVVQPGVSAGVSAPFVITEVWENHPVTWLQPVWVGRKSDGTQRGRGVFSVDDDSTFYSPFWQLEMIVNDELKDDNVDFRTARDVFRVLNDDQTDHFQGPLVYCPLLPEGVNLAQTSSGARDPLTRQLLTPLKVTEAVAEGAPIRYVDFGSGRFSANGQLPVASRAYFWVITEGGPVLPLAAVLPAQPKAHSFVTRVDMRVRAGAGVYVPTSRPDLRAKLLDLGLRVPVPSLANDNVDSRALQMTLNPDCFVDAGISSCTFIDSEAAVFASGVWLNEQPVQLAVGVVGP